MKPYAMLLKLVAAHMPLTPALETRICQDFVGFRAARGQVLLPQGEPCKEVFFLHEGCLRHVVTDEQGRENTCDFSFESQFATDIEAFTQRHNAHYSLVAVESCTGLLIGCEALMQLIADEAELEKFFRVVLEESFVRLSRYTRFRQLSPQGRFAWLMEHEPALFQRIPQQYLAGYIGIRPESLSRLKRRLQPASFS